MMVFLGGVGNREQDGSMAQNAKFGRMRIGWLPVAKMVDLFLWKGPV